MNKSLRRQYLEADLEQIDSFLSDTPNLRKLERIGFESRRKDILAELELLKRPSKIANVVLSFDGGPVTEGPGIDARFAGKALIEFQEFVAVINAAKTRAVQDIGRVPDSGASKLRVVGTVHGSFGFELQEIDEPQQDLFASSLSESVTSAARLIASAGQSDDAFIESMSAFDSARVQSTLGDFLKVVNSAHAVCKVTSDELEAVLDVPHVEAAVERVTNTNIEDVEEHYEGKFAGVTLDSRHFDHEINEIGGVIKGKVHEDVDRATMSMWDRKWLNKSCVAVVRRRTITRQKKVTTTHTLLRIEPLEGSKR
jgi:hypothetical protein